MKKIIMILGLVLFGILRSQTEETQSAANAIPAPLVIPHIYADATPVLQEMKSDDNLLIKLPAPKHSSMYSTEAKPTPRKTENQNKMKSYPKI